MKIRLEIANRAIAIASACVTASAALAWNGSFVKLNDYAETGTDGAIVVLGTPGEWDPDEKGLTVKEKVFDGDPETFFDPPSDADTPWAGIHLTKPMVLAKVRYSCRSGFGYRMRGLQIQGANSADFSDAVTLVTLPDCSGLQPPNYREDVFGSPDTICPYSYFRVFDPDGRHSCGNISELELYGFESTDQSPPAAPVFSKYFDINGVANLFFNAAAEVPLYEVCRIVNPGTDNETSQSVYLAYPDTGAVYWHDSGLPVVPQCEFRLRALNTAGASSWAVYTPNYRNVARGEVIGLTKEETWHEETDGAVTLFDGDITTYADADDGSNTWGGLDLGQSRLVIGVRYIIRDGWASRVPGAKFQVADNADFSDAVTIYEAPDERPDNVQLPISAENVSSASGRYVRMLSAPGGNLNMAEVEFELDASPNGLVE